MGKASLDSPSGKKRDKKESIDEQPQYLTFVVEEEGYAVDILKVKEIRPCEGIRHVPNTTDFIKGILNFRGIIVPVVDFRARFNLQQKPYTEVTVIIIIQIGDENELIGLIVDLVSGVCGASAEEHKNMPKITLKDSRGYMKSIITVDDKSIILLDCDKIVSDEKEVLNSMRKIEAEDSEN